MATLVMDPHIEEELLEKRRAWGGDKFDEVWDGVYVMSPLANNEHMELMTSLAAAIRNAFAARPDVHVFAGVNVSDRREGWEKNFRCPDVAVVLPGSRAGQDNSHVRAAEVFFPTLTSIAHVYAGKNMDIRARGKRISNSRCQASHKFHVLVVRQWRHDINSVPDFIELVAPPSATFFEKLLLDVRVHHQSGHDSSVVYDAIDCSSAYAA